MSKMIADIMPLKESRKSEVRMFCQIIKKSKEFYFDHFAIM